ncbi:hypothetical protein DE146DRAFT_304400 [Phaeosphaeria sp. MPI-PUGE-AT-0046c]|nr:hypothetical protein DE146DRAFT_304400 [Phaeosphaeria sp. MPI-PUGE-AT-0046c]
MKTLSIVFAALSLSAHALVDTRDLGEIEGPVPCLNNETYHPEDFIPASGLQLQANEVQVDAYVHILISKAANEPAKGSIEAKMDTLNRNFAPWGYRFNLRGVSIIINPTWASDIDVQKTEKQKALHKGRYYDLNIYMVEGAGGGVCSFPRPAGVKLTEAMLIDDGCFVPLSLPIQSATITHEVGHWMGLAHVFEGGCGSNDGCEDTWPQSGPSYGKQVVAGSVGSCPILYQCDFTGWQNVQNFMDYSDCASQFTPCQGGRMDGAWQNQRAGRVVSA